MADNSPPRPETTDWREQLPDDLKQSQSITKFKTIPDLAKSYLEIEKMMGSRVGLPKDDSPAEEWNGFYKSWGRPDKFDAYKIPDLPKELNIPDEFGKSLREMAHTIGLNQKQFEKLINWGAQQSMTALQAQQATNSERAGKLKKEWGFKYENNYNKAMRALAYLVGYKSDHPFLQYLETTSMGNDPEFLQMLFDLHERLGEDSFEDTKVTQEALAGDEAKKKINEIRADPKHPYFNENDPRHADAVKEMTQLYETAYPS